MTGMRKENVDWFYHSSRAVEHPKFKAMRKRYGWEGEGRFWGLNCMIAQSKGGWLDISKPYIREAVAETLGLTLDETLSFIEYTVDELGLVIQEKNRGITTEYVQQAYGAVTAYRKRVQAWRDARKSQIPKPKRKTGTAVVKANAEIEIAFKAWNSVGVRKHERLTPEMVSAYEKARRSWTREQIEFAIRNYGDVIQNPDKYWFSYKWTLTEFLSRKNAIEKFVDGACFENYAHKERKNGKHREVITDGDIKSLAEKGEKILHARRSAESGVGG